MHHLPVTCVQTAGSPLGRPGSQHLPCSRHTLTRPFFASSNLPLVTLSFALPELRSTVPSPLVLEGQPGVRMNASHVLCTGYGQIFIHFPFAGFNCGFPQFQVSVLAEWQRTARICSLGPSPPLREPLQLGRFGLDWHHHHVRGESRLARVHRGPVRRLPPPTLPAGRLRLPRSRGRGRRTCKARKCLNI